MKKETYNVSDLLFIKGYVTLSDGNREPVYATPYDPVDKNSINLIYNDLFIYKTRKFRNKIMSPVDQMWVKQISLRWLVVSERRLQIDYNLDIEKLSLLNVSNKFPFGIVTSSPNRIDEIYGDNDRIFKSISFCKLFDKECIVIRPYNMNPSLKFLSYIVRSEKLNLYRLSNNMIIIGEIDHETMNDYCHNIFVDIDDVIDYHYGIESISSFIQMVI